MTKLPLLTERSLPCMPCPHKTACCRWGVDISPEETDALVAKFGESVVNRAAAESAGDGWARTAVHDGEGSYCVFFLGEGKGCRIHTDDAYPSVCRLFPFHDVDGGPYQGDLSDCPELALTPSASDGERSDDT